MVKKLVICFLSLPGAILFVFAQWCPDTRLTFEDHDSWLPWNVRCVAATSEGIVHVVWDDDRDGNSEIYHKRNPPANSVMESQTFEIDSPLSFRAYATSSGIKFEGKVPFISPLNFRIYDITRRKLSSFVEYPAAKEFSFIWNTNHLPSGVYFVGIFQKNEFHKRARVV